MPETTQEIPENSPNTEKLPSGRFYVDIGADLVPAFVQSIQRHGPTSTLTALELLQWVDQQRKIEIPETNRILAEKMRREVGDIEIRGKAIRDHNLTYRYVSVRNEKELQDVIDSAVVHGGKKPCDDRVGICIDPGSKVSDYVTLAINQDHEPTALFVYDEDLLERLTPEEIRSDPTMNFVGGYGRKPKTGYTLVDALLGTVAIHTPPRKEYD